MAVSLRFIPGSTRRGWERQLGVVEYAGMDALVARKQGKRRPQRVPVEQGSNGSDAGDHDAWTPGLVSVPEEA